MIAGIAATLPRHTGGPVVLRALADYLPFTLTAVCTCGR